MSENYTGLPSLPLQLNAWQILGLRDPDEGEWSRLRAVQYRELHSKATTRVISHAVAALIVCWLFLGDISIFLMASWMLAVGLSVAQVLKLENGLRDLDHRIMTRREYNSHALSIIALSTIWAVPLLGFVHFGSKADHFGTWAIVAMMVSGSALRMPHAPITAMIWSVICGFAGTLSFLAAAYWEFVPATVIFCVVVIVGTINSARTFLTARIAEAGVAEKTEVVSLLLREFEENEADWLWQVDAKRRIKAASSRFAFALRSDSASLEGQAIVELLAGSRWKEGELPTGLRDLDDQLKRRESFSNLAVQVEVSGSMLWWELSGTPIFNEKNEYLGFRGVGSDVTEQRESSEKIAYLARYDTLTGLPNRLMLTEAMNDALLYAQQWKTRCAFLMVDLDRFKSVNDSLGHQVGDKMLAQVSQRLKAVMTENEQAGRLGGDEFAIVIRDAAKSGYVKQVADDIIAALSAPYTIDNHTLYIGASVGSALGPRDGTNVETLMRNADLALYRAKDAGGGEHQAFQPALHADAEERLKLEASLRHAIGNEELDVHFQPVVNAKTEKVVSFEALLRWNSDDHGFVSPAKFIPLAEDTRLIVPIGDWVLREACRQAVQWPDDIKVAVNVSGEQLLEPEFAKTVVRALADTNLPAHRLEVEVTESVFLRDGRTARQALEEIMALGCSVALDDFGTGYSSLGYLRTLRFSTIKVDRSFVQGASHDSPESLAIINAVVAMAQSLEMTTTAEGVEDPEQAAMVRELGCTKIQGYYFGRPLPAAEARALVVKHRNTAAA